MQLYSLWEIRCDEDSVGVLIEVPPFVFPPTTYRCHGKSRGVVIGANIGGTGVLSNVVNSIGIGARHIWTGKVVPLNLADTLGGPPFLPAVLIVFKDFRLLCVDGYDRLLRREVLSYCCADVAELRIAVFAVRGFFSFAVALETIVLCMQKLGDFSEADGMLPLGNSTAMARVHLQTISKVIQDPRWFQSQSGVLLHRQSRGREIPQACAHPLHCGFYPEEGGVAALSHGCHWLSPIWKAHRHGERSKYLRDQWSWLLTWR